MLAVRETLCADVVALYHVTSNGASAVPFGAIGTPYADEAMFLIDLVTYGPATFQHEFGHLLGARHQATGAQDTLSNDPDPGTANGHYIRVTSTTPIYPPPGNTAYYPKYCTRDIMSYPAMWNLGGISCTNFNDLDDFSDEYYSTTNRYVSVGGGGIGSPAPVNYPWGTAQANNVATMNTKVAQMKTFRNVNLHERMVGLRAAEQLNSVIVPIILE
jgi:hypothetical protein